MNGKTKRANSQSCNAENALSLSVPCKHEGREALKHWTAVLGEALVSTPLLSPSYRWCMA